MAHSYNPWAVAGGGQRRVGRMLSKAGSAYELLKAMAIAGELRPGRRLSAVDLAHEFRVSVTPIRDALVRLHAEGFIAGETGHGYFTKRFTVEEQADLHRLLFMHVFDAITRAPEAAVEAISEALPRLIDLAPTGDAAGAWVAEIDDVSAAIVSAGGNGIVGAFTRNATDRTRRIRTLAFEAVERRHDILHAVTELRTALLRGDRERELAIGDAQLARFLDALPDLVAEANAKALAQKFP